MEYWFSRCCLAICLLAFAQGVLKRCYSCRSRGDLGDCKDPFFHNDSTVENLRGVEATPCASGWCIKIIEGKTDEFDAATERKCVQRPPIDGEERCAETIIERNRPAYMCFCLGDLCNGSVTAVASPLPLLLTVGLVLLWQIWFGRGL